MFARMKHWAADRAIQLARRLLVWAVPLKIAADEDLILRPWSWRLPLKVVREKVGREVDEIEATIFGWNEWTLSEADINAKRLARRYDLGPAMNESANRALAALDAAKAAGIPIPDADVAPLSGAQKAALEYQQSYLQGIINRQAKGI